MGGLNRICVLAGEKIKEATASRERRLADITGFPRGRQLESQVDVYVYIERSRRFLKADSCGVASLLH